MRRPKRWKRRTVAGMPILLALLVSGCGLFPTDTEPIEKATKQIQETCASSTPTDDTAVLAPDVDILLRAYAARRGVPFRFPGGQADTTMPEQLDIAETTLVPCAPSLAERIRRAMGH